MDPLGSSTWKAKRETTWRAEQRQIDQDGRSEPQTSTKHVNPQLNSSTPLNIKHCINSNSTPIPLRCPTITETIIYSNKSKIRRPMSPSKQIRKYQKMQPFPPPNHPQRVAHKLSSPVVHSRACTSKLK